MYHRGPRYGPTWLACNVPWDDDHHAKYDAYQRAQETRRRTGTPPDERPYHHPPDVRVLTAVMRLLPSTIMQDIVDAKELVAEHPPSAHPPLGALERCVRKLNRWMADAEQATTVITRALRAHRDSKRPGVPQSHRQPPPTARQDPPARGTVFALADSFANARIEAPLTRAVGPTQVVLRVVQELTDTPPGVLPARPSRTSIGSPINWELDNGSPYHGTNDYHPLAAAFAHPRIMHTPDTERRDNKLRALHHSRLELHRDQSANGAHPPPMCEQAERHEAAVEDAAEEYWPRPTPDAPTRLANTHNTTGTDERPITVRNTRAPTTVRSGVPPAHKLGTVGKRGPPAPDTVRTRSASLDTVRPKTDGAPAPAPRRTASVRPPEGEASSGESRPTIEGVC